MVSGYHIDETETKNVKFKSKNRNIKKNKSLKAVPFVMTYYPKLKSMNKVILKYSDLLYMDKEVKWCLPLNPWFHSEVQRKLSSYLVKAKVYPTKRTAGFCKYGGKRFEVCIIVNEKSNFTSIVTGETYIINCRFDCIVRRLVYLLTCNKCKMQYVGHTISQFQSRSNN